MQSSCVSSENISLPYHPVNLKRGQQSLGWCRMCSGLIATVTPQAARWAVFNTLIWLVLDPQSHRKLLLDRTRTPEGATAVILRRRSTGSSWRRTQSVVTTASPPGTETRNYRRLLGDSCEAPWRASPAKVHCRDTVGTQAAGSTN